MWAKRLEKGTCFTLAAIHRVNADVTRFATNELQFNENDNRPEINKTWKTDPEESSPHL